VEQHGRRAAAGVSGRLSQYGDGGDPLEGSKGINTGQTIRVDGDTGQATVRRMAALHALLLPNTLAAGAEGEGDDEGGELAAVPEGDGMRALAAAMHAGCVGRAPCAH
jgi:hypothetical protein